MILPIYTQEHAILHQVAVRVDEITPELKDLVQNMRETMHNANGIGLAAPQVGQSVAICILEYSGDEDEISIPFTCLINPRITWKSSKKVKFIEGCLSIPGVEGNVLRPDRVRVKAKNLDGQEITLEASDLLARILQHEIDHLNGVLFTDYLQKRELISRKTPDYPLV